MLEFGPTCGGSSPGDRKFLEEIGKLYPRTLSGYASLSEADSEEAGAMLDESAKKMGKEAYLLMRIITTFVDEANTISKVEEDYFDELPQDWEGVRKDYREQAEMMDIAIQSILEGRHELIERLDAMVDL